MWKVLHASLAGTSHDLTNTPCQDACGFRRVKFEDNEFLLVAICDGAGSAACAQEGACAVVATWLDFASVELNLRGNIEEEGMVELAEACHGVLAQRAKANGRTIGDYACTMLTAVIGPALSTFFQVGDGVWVCGSKESSKAVTWPFQGEYAGEVVFLTSKDRRDHYQAHIIATPDSLAGTTDGLERLALDFRTQTAANDFFQPMWSTLRAGDPLVLESGLSDFLKSERVSNRTHDDKTLFLATRDASL